MNKINMKKIKISKAWAYHKFMCSKDYIINVCHGSCCQGSNKILISLLPNEVAKHEQNGKCVIDNKLQADGQTGICPYKNNNGLCALHGTSDKPFGCIASPFTINSNDTLIIRHRYSRMKCHGDGLYSYIVFRPSLNLIFGENEAQRICDELTMHMNDDVEIYGYMPIENYNNLKYLDGIKKQM